MQDISVIKTLLGGVEKWFIHLIKFCSHMQDGGMATWNPHLQFQRGSMLDPPATAGKARGTEWVTDFTVMANYNKIVLSTTSRELVFGDVSTPIFKCQYRIQGEKMKLLTSEAQDIL
jgi:hypothetical protein